MHLLFGTMLVGEVDRVPGLFSVKTRFGHLMYLPLLPLQTYVVFEGSEKLHFMPLGMHITSDFRGVEIESSFKSTLMGWLRGLLALAGVVFVVWCCGLISDVSERKLTVGSMLAQFVPYAVPFGLIAVLLMYPWKATEERALELAAKIGLSPTYVNKVYQQPAQPPKKKGKKRA